MSTKYYYLQHTPSSSFISSYSHFQKPYSITDSSHAESPKKSCCAYFGTYLTRQQFLSHSHKSNQKRQQATHPEITIISTHPSPRDAMMGHQHIHDRNEVITPHDHDVLSGRGNFVNYHAGNEHFRALVRKHKVAYVACPKQQKGKFSRMIVEEIRARNPPGRFLKQDHATKLWMDIGEKKALDKTRQALREGAPEIMKEITGDEDDAPLGSEADTAESSPLSQKAPQRTVRTLSRCVGCYDVPQCLSDRVILCPALFARNLLHCMPNCTMSWRDPHARYLPSVRFSRDPPPNNLQLVPC
jgi:hypothetical protein